MSSQRGLDKAERVASLAARLARCSEVAKHDTGEGQEAWALAHSFSDLEESFRTFLDDQLPRLAQAKLNPVETRDLIFEIGEEFRHILYHIQEPSFYRYLQEAEGVSPAS